MTLKYIVGTSPHTTVRDEPVALLFPAVLNHFDVAQRLHVHVLGAGFAHLADGHWVATGRSESLNIDSRPHEDGILLNLQQGLRP